MNAALLFGAVAILLPFVCEARRNRRIRQLGRQFLRGSPGVDAASVLNGQPARVARVNPSVENGYTGKAGTGGIIFSDPVWMGYDHGSTSYADAGACASGNAGDISTSGGECAGGNA